MEMQKARVHLTNGEIADLKIEVSNLSYWIDDVTVKGIATKEMYIPHHAIVYILFEQQAEDNNDTPEFEVELEGHK